LYILFVIKNTEFVYYTLIDDIKNPKNFEYFTFDKKNKNPLKLKEKKGITGNICALSLDNKNILITTYHFGGLNDECYLIGEKCSKIRKFLDIPIFDISIFTSDEDIKYFNISELIMPKQNDKVEIINVTSKYNKIKKRIFSTKIIKIEQQKIINNIFPTSPTIVVENNINEDLHGFSGSILLKDNIIIGIVSSVSNTGINCIPIYCIEKILKLNTSNYSCFPIETELYELSNDNDIFYGLNIGKIFIDSTNLLIDDCIIEINDKKFDKFGCIDNFCFEMYIILNYKVGQSVPLRIVRNDKIINVKEETLNFMEHCSVLPILTDKQKDLFGLIISEFDVSYENKNIAGSLKEMLNEHFGKNHFIIIGLGKSENTEKYVEKGFPIFELDNSVYYPILRYINGKEVNSFDDLKYSKTLMELIFEITPFQIMKITYFDEKIISID